MKPAHDLPAALRWKKALDIRDQKYQNTEQHCYLDYVVKEELHASADSRIDIKPSSCQQPPNQRTQPFHAKYLILYELPHMNLLSLIHSNASMCRPFL